jgi:ComF family protein
MGLLQLFFPKICNGCKNPLVQNEHFLCATCRHQLPVVAHHRNEDTAMETIFYGRIPIQKATALVQFQKKGITQELLHALKYKGNEAVSYFFGKWMGAELAEIPHYKTVDLVIPVPLHKQRLKKRGYNQVTGFGSEIAKALQVPFKENVLLKISKTESQVFKERFLRYANPANKQIFIIKNPETLTHKHILLVDDIVTTGATLENCAATLLKIEGVSISFATIAIA